MKWSRQLAIAAVLSLAPISGRMEQLSPTALARVPERGLLYVACATGNQVLGLELGSGKIVQRLHVPAPPLGIAASGDRLYVTCAAPASTVAVVDVQTGRIVGTIPVGHTAMAPVLHPKTDVLYVCNRFDNSVSIVDVAALSEAQRVRVAREPVAAAITPDGKRLLVANHLHDGRADVSRVTAPITAIDTASAKVIKEIALPNGSGLLRGICISPDGKYAAVTHLLSRFHVPTTQIDRGWINNNALTLLDVERLETINTVLLDEIDDGAANPWACAWSADGNSIVVTHAGTHELSVIDASRLVAKLASTPATVSEAAREESAQASRIAADVPNDLSFMVGLRRRVQLARSDHGPRAVCLIDSVAYVANYFSDTLSVVDLACAATKGSMQLSPRSEMTLARKGEFYFNDASICFQGWQSCGSCHSSDARVDGLNWDNLNDGIGNPKNVKSLLLAHETPPSMWLGVRSNAAVGVRAGIKNSLFTVQPPEVAEALDAYLKSLQAIPSPHLRNGGLSDAARRGEKLFVGAAGCAECHPKPLYTDLKRHGVGTAGRFDEPNERFDTPGLIEAWRTAPYLHDGSAATVRDVLTARNPSGRHGETGPLTEQELSDLIEFVLSL